jgi:hypothetical protein
MINSFDGNEEHDPGQTECEHDMYNRLDETKNFPVSDGFVSFMRTFKYLGSHISYNLRDDDDITASRGCIDKNIRKNISPKLNFEVWKL